MRLAMATSPSRFNSGTVPSPADTSHRVVGLLEHARRQVDFDLFAATGQLLLGLRFNGFSDFELGARSLRRRKAFVDINAVPPNVERNPRSLPTSGLRRSGYRDFVVEQVTALLAHGDEGADLVILFLNRQRQSSSGVDSELRPLSEPKSFCGSFLRFAFCFLPRLLLSPAQCCIAPFLRQAAAVSQYH